MSENIIQYVAAAANGDTDAMAKLYSRTLKASYFLASTLTDDSAAALEITKKAYAKAFCTIDKLKKPEAFSVYRYYTSISQCRRFIKPLHIFCYRNCYERLQV